METELWQRYLGTARRKGRQQTTEPTITAPHLDSTESTRSSRKFMGRIKAASSHKKMGNFMSRSLFLAVSLTSLMLASGGVSVALASEAQPALNIGFVLYSKGSVPGTLNARWTYQNIYSGKGLATGGPKEGFAGHYHVRYFDEQGKFSDEYDLVIEKQGPSITRRGSPTVRSALVALGWRWKTAWPSDGAGLPTS